MSIIWLPLVIPCFILTLIDFRIELFFASLVMLIMYSLFVFAVYKYSKSNKNYMIFDGETLIINYPNFQAKISIENIIEIEYYKISSFKAW